MNTKLIKNTGLALVVGMTLSASLRSNSEPSGMPDWVTSGDDLTSTRCVIASDNLSVDQMEALGKAQVALAQLLESQLEGASDSEELKFGKQTAGKTSLSNKVIVKTTMRGAKVFRQDYATINGQQYYCVKMGLRESERPPPPNIRPRSDESLSTGEDNPAPHRINPPPLSLSMGNGKRMALVIGNAAYSGTGQLKNPINDAKDMAAALEKLGFNVALVTDADRPAMDRAVRSFIANLDKDSEGLFYFSGHGAAGENGSNYLVPVQADIVNDSELQDRAYNLDILLKEMKQRGNRLNLVILDACRDNPFKGSKAMGGGLAQVSGPEGTLIAFASAPSTTASENRRGDNSLYTKHLLRHITEPGVTIEKMLKEVRQGVMEESKGRGKTQTPWENSSLLGDFCFAGCSAQ